MVDPVGETTGTTTIRVKDEGAPESGVDDGIFWVRDTRQIDSGTIPTTDMLIPGMTVTTPASAQDQVAFIDYTVLFKGNHTNRLAIWIDGTRVHPTGTTLGVTGGVHGSNDLYDASVSGIPVTLAAGSSHTIEIRWQASDSTAAVTLIDRSLAVTTR